MASQSHGCGGLTVTFSLACCTAAPLRSSSAGHLSEVGTLSGQPNGLSGRLWIPAAFRPPAFASSDIPYPPGGSASLAVGLPGPRPRTPSGLPRSTGRRCGWGRRPLSRVSRGCPLPAKSRAGFPPRWAAGPSPKGRFTQLPRCSTTFPGPFLTRFRMRVHLRSPCQPSPGPGSPAWFGTDLWALPSASRPPVTREARED
jgi:hypothetical protein